VNDIPESIPQTLKPLFDSVWMAAGWRASPLFNPDNSWQLDGQSLDDL
jgi:hypothetical protein